ncbi:anti-sigma F factor [Lysinibacillus fusiformis]|jgi:stage II sporulation protein AB (anti-sigma F factor)|uniref:Anti-sigma F factor n=1 Tax=Lysinibacillus fusiformis TaxID=28031 RepID=A0A1H9CML4_9BACI|nr:MULTISPECIES: anti-sigma F factor [Lysinibacillus]EAZ87263.1 anti-sigma F factor [Bacillus sp. B14905]AJK88829.1 anti-sigma F factor [Lysinibacillus fusiformis]KAB0441691.1 anti-sigma F factor [Lysinibacillus fusiformis]KEK09793.1 anti-sigma F factor [Lysinibacillus sphaericus]KGA82964.1 anti-sigma F factor [Lysinibacillus fusiformis]
MDNEMTLTFLALSENEALARVAVTGFIAQLDPTIDELSEFKTVVSEAVSNAIIHGYEEDGRGVVTVHAKREDDIVTVSVMDKGVGIEDVSQAMEPLFTTKSVMERSGMGFTIMDSFSDQLTVMSKWREGTTVTFTKKFYTVRTAVM